LLKTTMIRQSPSRKTHKLATSNKEKRFVLENVGRTVRGVGSSTRKNMKESKRS